MNFGNEPWMLARAENEANIIKTCQLALDNFKEKAKEYPIETPVTAAIRKLLIQKKLYKKNVVGEKYYPAITRWLFTQKLYDPTNDDPILSKSNVSDIGFSIYVKDRNRSSKIEKKIKTERNEILETLQSVKNVKYTLETNDNGRGKTILTIVTSYGECYTESITTKQLEKMRRLYNQHLQEDKKEIQVYFERLYICIATYNSLLSEGYQGAIPPSVFKVLEKYLEVDTELFASPLNATLSNFYTAFPSTDKYFGSKGSFFDEYENIFSAGGSFECNPPFTEEHIYCIAKIVDKMLTNHNVPLSVTLILPAWEDCAGFRVLFNTKHKRLFLSLRRFMHIYVTKNSKQVNEPRLSQAYSYIFVLQNKEGADKWPVTKDFVRDILRSFRPSIIE